MTMFRQHAAAFLIGVAALGACESDGSPPAQPTSEVNTGTTGVSIITDRTSYPQGAQVGLTLASQDADPLAYNACTRDLEKKEGASWVPGPESLRLCTREVWYLAPGARRTDTTDLDIGLAPGEYRIVIGFTADGAAEGESIRGVTNPFIVEP